MIVSALDDFIHELLEPIYGLALQYYETQLDALIRENNALYGTQNCVGLICNGERVFLNSYTLPYHPLHKLNPVQERLKEEVEGLIRRRDTCLMEKNLLEVYFRLLCAKAKGRSDLYDLLPPFLRSVALRCAYSLFPNYQTLPALTQKEVDAFHKKQSKYVELIKTRMTLNQIQAY
jgi:hypothetical protein